MGSRNRWLEVLKFILAVMVTVALIVWLILGLSLTANAHEESELHQWQMNWYEQVRNEGLRFKLLQEYLEMSQRHPDHFYPHVAATPTQPSSTRVGVSRGMGSNVEQWRGLTAQYFTNVERALCLMSFESGGNPNATSRAGARGLMQVMPFWADHFGVSRDSLYDPATNLFIASKILAVQGWSAWDPYKRGECR